MIFENKLELSSQIVPYQFARFLVLNSENADIN